MNSFPYHVCLYGHIYPCLPSGLLSGEFGCFVLVALRSSNPTRTIVLLPKTSQQSAYALVLSGNHVFTSGAQGTNAAAVRGALRANQTDLLTVVLPQSFEKQTSESQELLNKVKNIIAFPERDGLSLEMASRLCNSFLLNQTDQLISFAFHESSTVIEAVDEAKEKKKLVTMLFLD